MMQRPANWTFALLAGCSFGAENPHWSDDISPSGPCWEVNLVDGLDESSTTEIHNLYACLNRTGNLEPLGALDQALDTPGRDNRPVGLTVARLANALPTSGYDLFGLAGKALQLLETFHTDSEAVLGAMVELIYGQAYEKVATDFEQGAMGELEAGIIAPGLTLISESATTLLDHGAPAQEAFIELIDSDIVGAGVCTAIGVISTEDPTLKPVGESLMANLGDAWLRTNNHTNDLWAGASGNSVHDLIDAMALGDAMGPIELLKPPIQTLLGDDMVQRNTRLVLQDAAAAGSLVHLPSQVEYFADVDTEGIPLTSPSAGETSALQAAARLLYAANTDVACSIELPVVPDFEFSLGNLSVAILRRIAEMEEGRAVSTVDFIGDILDFGLTETILGLIVDAGVCPVFTDQLVADLAVVERLNDPAAGDLVSVLHGMLDAVYKEGQLDRLPELVEIMATLHSTGLLPPLEEVLRDLASSRLFGDLTVSVQTVIDPTPLNTEGCLEGTTPLDFDLLWTAADDALGYTTGPSVLSDVLQSAIDGQALWTVVDNGAVLVAQEDARIHALPSLVVDALSVDNDGTAISLIRSLISNTETWETVLILLETDDIVDAMTHEGEEIDGPLPFVASLILSDTVTVMLQTVDLLLDSLGASDTE
jgi:hypothetical protein